MLYNCNKNNNNNCRSLDTFKRSHCVVKFHFIIFFSGLTIAFFAAVGVTGGAHRLWAHRSYKAKWPMRVILMIFQTMAFQVNFSVILLNKFIYMRVEKY